MNDSIFEKLFPFQEARNNQREVIEKIISAYENGKKYVILNAPTGSGKSAIGLTVARYYTCSYFLTSQKVLQEQYYKDFKIPYVFGRASYTCRRDSLLTCEFGECLKKYGKYGNCKDCPYINSRDLALNSAHNNLNYSFYLKIARKSSTAWNNYLR